MSGAEGMEPRNGSGARRGLHGCLVVLGSAFLTLVFFLVLPLIQAIAKGPVADRILTDLGTGVLPPPPPPPPEDDADDEPEEEPEPPELTEEAAPLDLAQLELALNPGFGKGLLAGDFTIQLDDVVSGGDGMDALFSLADLDQEPRVVFQPQPTVDSRVRKKAPGKVYVLFVVDENGRVQNPIVQSSTDPVFERPALSAVKQWKFEPGKRNGEAVRFRMRVPITFPGGAKP